jgi:DNA-binding NtrC family response regulator
MKHILVIDDELGPRESLKAVFAGRYTVTTAANHAEAMTALSQRTVDLVILDVILPDKDGIAILKEILGLYPRMPVVMISASTSVRPVVEAIQSGAYDYLPKPFDVEEVLHVVHRALESKRLKQQVEALETEVNREYPVQGIVGRSSAFMAAIDNIRKAAETDATVLITGESGTGKELAARLLHTLSSRRKEPFVAVHCAALPESLMESELFGHEKGAFTGADRQKPGRFDLAGSGTLFFDEVGEMPLTTQVKLLRVLQEREFMRVGGTRVIRTDARIVAATARELRDEIREERFRDDLYYRLSVVPVHLPPLRERQSDIPLLAEHFLAFFSQNIDTRLEGFSASALAAMSAYAWPGNIRELRNIIERIMVLHRRERMVEAAFLPEEISAHSDGVGAAAASPPPPPRDGRSLQETMDAFEKRIIEDALRETNGIQTRAAEKLGTTRRILRYRMEKLDIDVGRG